jgi:hypothetical protein
MMTRSTARMRLGMVSGWPRKWKRVDVTVSLFMAAFLVVVGISALYNQFARSNKQ